MPAEQLGGPSPSQLREYDAELAKLEAGEYVAIDLDANNREAVGTFGWGVCRHGHGLQDLPPLSESQARSLAVKLNS